MTNREFAHKNIVKYVFQHTNYLGQIRNNQACFLMNDDNIRHDMKRAIDKVLPFSWMSREGVYVREADKKEFKCIYLESTQFITAE